jgi:DNA polymerase-3 subunit alpha
MSQEIFCHLKVHSDFSLGRAASQTIDYINRSKELNIPAFALSDSENMFDVLNFSLKAKDYGVQPIMACQFNFMDNERKKLGQIQLYAMDAIGYINLCRLVRSSHEPYQSVQGMLTPSEPMLDLSMLKDFNEGLICLTGGGNNGLTYNLLPKRQKDTEKLISQLKNIFQNRLYLEICRNGGVTQKEADIEDILINIANKLEIPLVATTDIWYATPDRHDAWLLMDAVNRKDVVMVQDVSTDNVTDFLQQKDIIVSSDKRLYYMRSAEEMKEMFSDLPEAYENTKFIALRCHYHALKRDPILPPFACDGGRTETEELREQAKNGLRNRIEHIQDYRKIHNSKPLTEDEEKKYWDRLDFELSIIDGMGFPGYFLIVSDFIKWAKNNDIPVGPGRGSGAGSVVAWSMMITDLDPLQYGLLFERFLNPERVSMPDFDVDFCKDGRERVIEYVKQKYGSDHVAMIRAFGKVKSKTALSDMQRILIHETNGKIGFNEVKLMTKSVPDVSQGNPMKLCDIYKKDDNGNFVNNEAQDFRNMITSDGQKLVLRNAMKVEGLHRNKSAHAAGIVIGDRPIDQLCPVSWDENFNMPVASFDGKGVESSGLVKYDFLGLKNLSVIKLALHYINKDRDKKDFVDITKIDMTDAEVYKQFASGHSVAVFQFESAGMQDVLHQIKPTRFEDLIAAVSLFRPGPLAYIPDYARCKNGLQKPKYPMPEEKTKPFLEETFGIMVYQEQVMQVAQACAGYSLGGADLLRRAMGKKIKEEMVKQKQIFIYGSDETNPPIPGAVKLGMSEKLADKLFDDIESFANYGFNKSHAAAYALISYQTMWLKTHYPMEFMAATMSYIGKSKDKEKDKIVLADLKRMGIKVLSPDINKSGPLFIPEYGDNPGIRFGLKGLNGFSNDLCDLEEDRKQNGPYKDIVDFYSRVGNRFSKDQLENLAKSGAFDSVMNPVNRKQASEILKSLNEHKAFSKQILMDESMKGLSFVEDWSSYCKIEHDAIGYYFNVHPSDEYKDLLKPYGFRKLSTWMKYMNDNNISSLSNVKFTGIMTEAIYKTTALGNGMIRMRVEDSENSYWCVMFAGSSNLLNNNEIKVLSESLYGAKESGIPLLFEGKLSLDGEKINLVIDKIQNIDSYKASLIEKILIKPTFKEMLPHMLYGLTNEEQYKVMRDAYYAIEDSCDGQPDNIWLEKANEILEENIEEVALGYGEYLKNCFNNKNNLNFDGNKLPVYLHNIIDDKDINLDLFLSWNTQTLSFFVASHITYEASYKKPLII